MRLEQVLLNCVNTIYHKYLHLFFSSILWNKHISSSGSTNPGVRQRASSPSSPSTSVPEMKNQWRDRQIRIYWRKQWRVRKKKKEIKMFRNPFLRLHPGGDSNEKSPGPGSPRRQGAEVQRTEVALGPCWGFSGRSEERVEDKNCGSWNWIPRISYSLGMREEGWLWECRLGPSSWQREACTVDECREAVTTDVPSIHKYLPWNIGMAFQSSIYGIFSGEIVYVVWIIGKVLNVCSRQVEIN